MPPHAHAPAHLRANLQIINTKTRTHTLRYTKNGNVGGERNLELPALHEREVQVGKSVRVCACVRARVCVCVCMHACVWVVGLSHKPKVQKQSIHRLHCANHAMPPPPAGRHPAPCAKAEGATR
jgi:hypothetical protein